MAGEKGYTDRQERAVWEGCNKHGETLLISNACDLRIRSCLDEKGGRFSIEQGVYSWCNGVSEAEKTVSEACARVKMGGDNQVKFGYILVNQSLYIYRLVSTRCW
jgi:hypothetical protein